MLWHETFAPTPPHNDPPLGDAPAVKTSELKVPGASDTVPDVQETDTVTRPSA